MVIKKSELPEINDESELKISDAEEKMDKFLQRFYNRGQRLAIPDYVFENLPKFLHQKFLDKYRNSDSGWNITCEYVSNALDDVAQNPGQTIYYIE